MWMTLEELATYLRVSKETAYKLAQQKKIPGAKIGNLWRFRRETIDTWLEAQEQNNQLNTPSKKQESVTPNSIGELK